MRWKLIYRPVARQTLARWPGAYLNRADLTGAHLTGRQATANGNGREMSDSVADCNEARHDMPGSVPPHDAIIPQPLRRGLRHRPSEIAPVSEGVSPRFH